MYDRCERFAHKALAGKALPCPVADCGGLGGPTSDVVYCDCANELLISTAKDEKRKRSITRHGTLRPIDTVGKGAAREVVDIPARFPRCEIGFRVMAQCRPAVKVRVDGRAQCEALCLEPQFFARPHEHQAARFCKSAPSSGAPSTGP